MQRLQTGIIALIWLTISLEQQLDNCSMAVTSGSEERCIALRVLPIHLRILTFQQHLDILRKTCPSSDVKRGNAFNGIVRPVDVEPGFNELGLFKELIQNFVDFS
jgi:hypothetical protein